MLNGGAGRTDITLPVGIAQAGWGAATHERAEGIDMPFYSTALYVTDSDIETAIVESTSSSYRTTLSGQSATSRQRPTPHCAP